MNLQQSFRFDVQFLQNTRTLYPGKIYRFTISDRTILHCQLPQFAITSLTSVENMQFMPPAKRQREEDTIHGISVDHTPDPSVEYLLPAYTGQYDSRAPPFDGTQQHQFTWTADTRFKLTTIMQTVWGALTKTRCPPPPSCCRAP
ncbi:unnamed protein product [Brassica oleracea]